MQNFGNLQIHNDKIGKFKDLWRKNLEFSKTEGIKLEISKSINENGNLQIQYGKIL